MAAGMRALAAAALFSCVLAGGDAHAERPYTAIEQRLSAEQMRATGLDQLRPEQLSLLNRLLSNEQAAIAAQSAQDGRERRGEEAMPVSSSVKGEFRGWQNGTMFELENGQRWRVVDSDFQAIRPMANPKVTISPGAFGSWYMLVEGTSVKVKVKRVDP
jgi:hypothetical protein